MQVNMLDAKNNLSRLVAAVERGEDVIIARGGVPVARIVKYNKPKVQPPGAWKGLVRVSKGWDSAETNAMVEKLFYGETRRTSRQPASPSKSKRPVKQR